MKPRPVRVCGPFLPDPTMPRDHRDREFCRNCSCAGAQGDARHPNATPATPTPARPWPPALAEAAHEREAAILGEKDDDE